MNSKGEEIFYRVNDDRDRHQEWVVKQHLDRAEHELEQLQQDVEAVLRSQKLKLTSASTHVRGNRIRSTLLIVTSNLRPHTGP